MFGHNSPARKTRSRRAGDRLQPWHVVAVFVLVYVMAVLYWHNWDPMSFVLIGGTFDPTVAGDSLGYDGQFAYQIARQPFGGWRYVDVPAYRYQRILYPMAARLLSWGIPKLIPWALILINVVALVAGTVLTETVLMESDANRWYALTYGLFVGLLMAVRLDLTEPLAFLLVQGGVLAFAQDRQRIGGFLFALAALTREVTLLFPMGYALYMVSRHRWRQALEWGMLVGTPFAVWQVALRLWLGDWGIGSGGALSTPFEWIPFRGWWKMAILNLPAFVLMSVLIVPLTIVPAILSLVAGVRSLAREQGCPAVWALLTNAAIVPFLPMSNILDPLGLSRITAGLLVAVLNFGAQKRSRATLNYGLLWILTAIFIYKDSLLPQS